MNRFDWKNIVFVCVSVAFCFGVGCEKGVETEDASPAKDATKSTASANDKVLRVVYFPVPPHIMRGTDSEHPKGAAVDFLMEITKEMGMVPVFQELPVPRCLRELETGRVDMGAVFSKSAEREKKILYPNCASGYDYQGLLVLKNSPIQKVDGPDDLKGLRIGFIQGNALTDVVRDSDVTMDLISGDKPLPRLIRKLLANHVDAVAWGERGAMYEAGVLGVRDQVRTVRLPGPPTLGYSIFRPDERGRMLLKRFERAHKKVSEARPYETFLEKY